ncbi:hypothetical protein ACWCPQ_26565 [Nocardia sp. NPDC001965]
MDYPNGDAVHLRVQWQDRSGGAKSAMRHMGDPTVPLEQAVHPDGVILATDTERGAALMLCDQQGRPRIRLQVAPDGTPSIAMPDEEGKVVRQL